METAGGPNIRHTGGAHGNVYDCGRSPPGGHRQRHALSGCPDGPPGGGARVRLRGRTDRHRCGLARGRLRGARCGPPTPAGSASPSARPAATAPAPVAEAPATTAPGVTPVPEPLAGAPPSATPEQALIAHLERALAQALVREQRLLDLVAQCTGQRAVTTSGGSEDAISDPSKILWESLKSKWMVAVSPPSWSGSAPEGMLLLS